MSLFGNKKKELPPLISNEELDRSMYDQVVDFLVSVNDKDYLKIIKVADIYRAANIEVARATGVKQPPQPSIFKQQGVTIHRETADDDIADSLLDDDDELMAAFEGSEPDEPASAPKKVSVKNEKGD